MIFKRDVYATPGQAIVTSRQNLDKAAGFQLSPALHRAYRQHWPERRDAVSHVRFSNRPVGVKCFQAVHCYGVDVARGLVLLFGIGTRASAVCNAIVLRAAVQPSGLFDALEHAAPAIKRLPSREVFVQHGTGARAHGGERLRIGR